MEGFMGVGWVGGIDCFLFFRASIAETRVIKQCLHEYGESSSQQLILTNTLSLSVGMLNL